MKFWHVFAGLVIAAAVVGCLRPVDPPSPEPAEPDVSVVPASDVQAPYRELRLAHARIHREAAAKARAGEIATQAQEAAFLDPEMVKARLKAFASTAALEQSVLGADDKGRSKWTPERMATFREALADALEAER